MKEIRYVKTIYNRARSHTSNAEENSPKGNPSFFSISFEEIYDVFWIESTQYTNVMFEQVVETNAADEQEPQQNNRCKGVAHFISPKSLSSKENDQDYYGNPHNSICINSQAQPMLENR